MPARRYMEEIGSAAKRSAGVAPKVNLGEHVTHMPLPSANKAAHSGFETQRRCHQKSKMGISGPIKRIRVLQKNSLKKEEKRKKLSWPKTWEYVEFGIVSVLWKGNHQYTYHSM